MWKSVTQAVVVAASSVLLGVYLASGSEHTVVQALMLSFPPASLWLAVRRNRPVAQPHFEHITVVETPDRAPVITVAQTLDIERLVQAS